jgi:hypothetical protein
MNLKLKPNWTTFIDWVINGLQLFVGPWTLFSFVFFFEQSAGLLGWVISPSQGRYPHTGQHKHRLNAHTNIHALSGIRTNDRIVWAREDSSCLRVRPECSGAWTGALANFMAETAAAAALSSVHLIAFSVCHSFRKKWIQITYYLILF